ncbi:uncharacterized protein LOC131242731 isoform X2 [Magnolia sinica]|uniref:uncharacterized protein LOC131242731 isoform X2 n=1 Tax=Magnolia sinica TaxID=86752 RepID=UPI00265964E6|nr:uncharacterized protein LOC131242731 isoform X2 [Magnolia sinica]
MTPANLAGQFGDTTYTKVFVGGLAWETQRETMRKYFEQFGEILEAVVITDKNTGKSKGYGFVTFRDPEAATKACVDASPVIDGRRTNCNLASLGVQRSRPSTPKHGHQGGVGSAFPSAATFPHYAIQPGIPYNVYGYSQYSPDYTYPTSYYNVYGGGGGSHTQYPMYGGAAGVVTGNTAFYPYFQVGHGNGPGHYSNGYGLQYQHVFPYSAVNSTAFPQHYGGPVSLPPTPPSQAGMNMSSIHHRHIPNLFTPAAPEQPSA